MNPSLTQCRYLCSRAEIIFTGLDDSHRAVEPEPGLKTAGWLIGHLAVTGDFGRRLCGRRPICPTEWRAAFNPGSTPSTEDATYPPMAELQDAFRSVYADLASAIEAADPALLGIPNPYMPARAGFPTAGDFANYIASGHLAYHLGQLVAWRAAAGLGRLQRPEVQTA